MNPQDRFDLVCYGPEDIDALWPTVAPLIQRGLDEGSDYTIHDILSGLTNSEMQLWTAQKDGIRAALVTALHDDYCLLAVVGGEDVHAWKDWLKVLEVWAKEKGARELRIYGRRGWLRVLPGFEVRTTEMVKVL